MACGSCVQDHLNGGVDGQTMDSMQASALCDNVYGSKGPDQLHPFRPQPEQGSVLPVVHHSPGSLQQVFGQQMEWHLQRRITQARPGGFEQKFLYTVCMHRNGVEDQQG